MEHANQVDWLLIEGLTMKLLFVASALALTCGAAQAATCTQGNVSYT